MRSLRAFWSACERLYTAGVALEWEKLIKDPGTLNAARQILVPAGRLSQQFPCTAAPWCTCMHEVVVHADGTKVAICVCEDNDCPAIPVTDDDLVIHQFDFARLFRGIGKAIGFDARSVEIPELRMTYHIGDYTWSNGQSLPVFFSMPNSAGCFSDTLLKIGFRFGNPFVVFTTSQYQYDLSATEIGARDGVLILLLTDLALLDGDGKICIDGKVMAVVDEFAGKALRVAAAAEAARPDGGCAIPESVFRQTDNFHNIWVHGRKIRTLSNMQADVVRVLYEAAIKDETELRFAAISSRMKEPSGCFGNVFRADDDRREVVRMVKRGIFQLNI